MRELLEDRGGSESIHERGAACEAPNTSRFPPCYSDRRTNGGASDGGAGGGHATLAHSSTVERQRCKLRSIRPSRNTSRWDQQGAEYVRSNIDWCARCSKRLVGLNPGADAEHALDLAHDLARTTTCAP